MLHRRRGSGNSPRLTFFVLLQLVTETRPQHPTFSTSTWNTSANPVEGRRTAQRVFCGFGISRTHLPVAWIWASRAWARFASAQTTGVVEARSNQLCGNRTIPSPMANPGRPQGGSPAPAAIAGATWEWACLFPETLGFPRSSLEPLVSTKTAGFRQYRPSPYCSQNHPFARVPMQYSGCLRFCAV